MSAVLLAGSSSVCCYCRHPVKSSSSQLPLSTDCKTLDAVQLIACGHWVHRRCIPCGGGVSAPSKSAVAVAAKDPHAWVIDVLELSTENESDLAAAVASIVNPMDARHRYNQQTYILRSSGTVSAAKK